MIKQFRISTAVLGCLAMLVFPVSAALFTQDFSSSTNYTDYVNATTPSQNQFTLVTGAAYSIDAGRLKVVNSAGTVGNVRRWVDMVGTPVGALSLSFDMELYFSEAANTRLMTGQIGEPVNGGNFMAWGIDATGTDNEWKVTGTAAVFTGVQNFKIFANNSGAALDYTDPLGGAQSLATNSYDIWVGTTLVADGKTDLFTHPDKLLTSFTASVGQSTAGEFTAYLDNFQVETIPEPTTIGLVGFSSGVLMLFRRRRMQFRK